jgi:hypothetical protein
MPINAVDGASFGNNLIGAQQFFALRYMATATNGTIAAYAERRLRRLRMRRECIVAVQLASLAATSSAGRKESAFAPASAAL